MNEFIVLLIVVFVILAVLTFLFGFGQIPFTPQKNNVTLAEIKVGSIGFTTASAVNKINVPAFTAGTTQDETLESVDKQDISANILLGGASLKLDIPVNKQVLEVVNKAIIEFDVAETNQYAPLIVKWNGEEVSNRYMGKDHYEISVEKGKVKDANTLEIITAGSIRFWAYTVYSLSNLKVNVEYGYEKLVTLPLSATELQTLEKIEIGFVTTRADLQGELIVRVNGEKVYQKRPQRVELINFTYLSVPLRPGNNIVSFVATDGKFDLDSIEIKVYSLSQQLERTTKFTVPEDRKDLLNRTTGIMWFNVDQIKAAGGLTININGREFRTQPQVGQNNLTFPSSILKIGENQLGLSATGSFEIPVMKITLE